MLFLLGLIGLALPLWPTTVFWILAVFAADRGRPELAQRIRRWPGVGAPIAAFCDHGAISPAGKRLALAGMALSAGLLAWTLSFGLGLWLSLGALAIAAIFVVSRPSPPRDL